MRRDLMEGSGMERENGMLKADMLKIISISIVWFVLTGIPAWSVDIAVDYEVGKYQSLLKTLETEITMIETQGSRLKLMKVDKESTEKVMGIFVNYLKKIQDDVYSSPEEKKKFMSEIMLKRLQFSEEYWTGPAIRNFRFENADSLLPELITKYAQLDYQERLRTSLVLKRFSTEKLNSFDSRQKDIEFNSLELKFLKEFKKVIEVSGKKFFTDNRQKESKNMMNDFVSGLNDLKFTFDAYSFILMDSEGKSRPRISEEDVDALVKYREMVIKKLPDFSYIDMKEELKNIAVREEWFRYIQKNISDSLVYLKDKGVGKLRKVDSDKLIIQKEIIRLETKNLDLKDRSKKDGTLWTEIVENIKKIDHMKQSLGQENMDIYVMNMDNLVNSATLNLKNINNIFPIFRDLRTEILTAINSREELLKKFVKDFNETLQGRRNLKLDYQRQLLELQKRSSEFYTDYVQPKAEVNLQDIEEKYLDVLEIIDFIEKYRKLYKELTSRLIQLVEHTSEGRHAMNDLFEGKIYYDRIPVYLSSTGWSAGDVITAVDDINKPDPMTLVKTKIHEDSLDLEKIRQKIQLWKEKILVFDIEKKKRLEDAAYRLKVRKYKNNKISVNIDLVMQELRKWEDVKDIPYHQKYDIAKQYDELKRKIDVLIRDNEIMPEVSTKFENMNNVWNYFKNRVQWSSLPCEVVDITINNVRMTDRIKEINLHFDDTKNGTIEILLKLREEFYPVETVYCKLIDLKDELIKGYRVEKKGKFSYWKIFFPVPFKNERFRFTFTARDRYENVLSDTFRTYTVNCTWFDERRALEMFIKELFECFNNEDITGIQKFFNRYNFNNGNLDTVIDGIRRKFEDHRRLYVKVRDLKWDKVSGIYRVRIKWNKHYMNNAGNQLKSNGITFFSIRRFDDYRIVGVTGDSPF